MLLRAGGTLGTMDWIKLENWGSDGTSEALDEQKSKKNEMCGGCGTKGAEMSCIKRFGGET